VTDDIEKATVLNDYFVEVGTIDNGILPKLVRIENCTEPSTLSTVYFDSDLVKKCISKIKTKSAAGPDGFASVIFKQLLNVISDPLAMMFRLIMQFGEVPDSWKEAIVTPVFKKGSSSKTENYRPISITSICCKLFEAGIKLSLMQFLNENNLLSASQHGFLSKHSTCSNLLETLNDWTEGLDNKYDTLVAYVDFAKAFDKVSIPKLLYKLNHFGIKGSLLNCIRSFLTNRTQRVRVGGQLSGYRPVGSGVPQGSVLGPILFLIYINDIVSSVPPGVRVKLFADDLKSYVTLKDIRDVEIFAEMLNSLSVWSDTWQLPLSVSKCNWMHISNRRVTVPLTFNLDENELSIVDEIKDLGVLFNSNLNFANHITAIIGSARQRLFLLKKCFASSNSTALIIGYKTYVLPILEYCSQVWSPQYSTEIARIESVQRMFLKRLEGFQSLSYCERLSKAGLSTLERRRIVADLVLCYKILHSLISVEIDRFFDLAIDCKTRGHPWKLKVLNVRTNSRLFFFANRVVNVWNSLSVNTVCADTLQVFKDNLQLEDLSSFLTVQIH
jgi:ribonuclease P/MRP protein subunit RPP40